MNTILFLISIVLLPTAGIVAHQQPGMDYVEGANIYIMNASNKSYSLASAAELQKAFGKGTVRKFEDEVLGGFGYIHKYKGLEVYFNKKNFEEVTITEASYRVFLKGKAYRVGDSISKLQSVSKIVSE